MHPKPKLHFVLALLLAFGRFVAKPDTKLWLDDMHYELAFIEGFAAKFRFAWGALGLAFKSRFESASISSSRNLVLATATAATLLVVVLFIPNFIMSPQPTTQSMPVLVPLEQADADLAQPAPAVAAEAAIPASPRMTESANSIEADLNDRAASSSGTSLFSEESADDTFEGSVAEASSELSLPEAELGEVAASQAAAQASQFNLAKNAIVSESLDPPYLALELESSVLLIRALRQTVVTVDAESQVEYQLEEGQELSLSLPVSLATQSMSSLLFLDGDLPIQGFMAQGYARVDVRQKAP